MEQLCGHQRSPDILQYFQSGQQTEITPSVLAMALCVRGATLSGRVQSILEQVHSLPRTGHDRAIFRTRTAAEIIDSKYVTGCSDEAFVCIALARATGFAAKYVETISKQWVQEGGDFITGHMFVQIYDQQKCDWVWVDPRFGCIDQLPEDWVVLDEGLDGWDIGITDYDSLSNRYNLFRNEWVMQQNSPGSPGLFPESAG